MAENKDTNEDFVNDNNPGAEENAQATEKNAGSTTDNSTDASDPAAQVAALNDKYLRLYSEFDNYRKRTNKEKLDLIATASAGVLKDLVSIMDDFERAIANNENSNDIDALKEGFKLIHHKMRNTLESKGLKQMSSKGQPFDPELHEAIANIPAPVEELKGKVVDDVEKGYFLNDKVLRYAKVVVGQ